MTKTVDQLITEDFFFTLPYYCNAPEPYMRQKVKELFAKWLKEIKLDACIVSMMAIYEDAGEWNKGFKAGAADMMIRLQKELSSVDDPIKKGSE